MAPSPSRTGALPESPVSGILALQRPSAVAPFLIGGASGMVATTCLQPIDTIKVHIQLTRASSGTNIVKVIKDAIADTGVLCLYDGLSAAYLRQCTYTTLRIGFFDRSLDFFERRAAQSDSKITFKERTIASMTSGALAAFIANPAEVALVRMQSDRLRPMSERKNYQSVIQALMDIGRKEGLAGLWRGAWPTTCRAVATNFGQLAFFTECKSRLRPFDMSEQSKTIAASATAGFAAAALSMPLDFIKTRMQRDVAKAGGASTYKSMGDCIVKVTAQEGISTFYRGFGLYLLRIMPHAVITLVVADNLRGLVSGTKY